MVKLEFNGKPFDPNSFEDALMAEALKGVVEQCASASEVSGTTRPESFQPS